jgi:ATP-dependent RNA helicase RhlE
VKGIELVLNYDLPDNPGDYVHRIGRTGRAGHEGHAISFATPDQGTDVRAIERLTRVYLPISKLPELPPARAQAYVPRELSPYQQRHGARPQGSRYEQKKPYEKKAYEHTQRRDAQRSGQRNNQSRGASSGSSSRPSGSGSFPRRIKVTF